MDAIAQPQVNPMQTFVDELINKRFAGEEGITDDVKKELAEDATERLNNYVLEATLDELSDADVDVFSQMIEEKKSPEELQQFVQTHITDYPGFMQDVFDEFQETYLAE